MIGLVLAGVVLAGFAVLLYGLLTKRIPLQKQGCCPADPDLDLRMRTNDEQRSAARRNRESRGNVG